MEALCLAQAMSVSTTALKEHDRDGEREEKKCLWESIQEDDMKQGSRGKKLKEYGSQAELLGSRQA